MATFHLLLSIVILSSVASVSCQIAGAGGYAIKLTAPGDVPPTHWASISQNTNKMEWDNLTNAFSVQFWAYWNGPGLLNQEVIVSRHPGAGEVDARSHFVIGLKAPAGTSDWRLTAWLGCGVAVGFSLTSSTPFPLRTWTRVNLVVNGDGTFDPAAKAYLYQNGEQVAVSSWNTMGCDTRYGIQWDENSVDVRLGYYDNQDFTDSAQTSNPRRVYGFNGEVDELSFFPYPVAVNPNQTFEYLGNEPGLLYFQFNEGPRDPPFFQDFRKKANPYLTGRAAIENVEGPHGVLVPNDRAGWVWSTLRVNQVTDIKGTNVPLFNTPVLNTFTVFPYLLPVLPPTPAPTPTASNQTFGNETFGNETTSTPTNASLPRATRETEDFSTVTLAPANVYITDVSADLLAALTTGQVELFNVNFVRLTSFPFYLPGSRLRVVVKCPDTTCKLGYLFFEYTIGGSSAFVRFDVRADCPSGRFDICGECDGDNRTCTCACYHGFRTNYMAYQLFRFGLEQISAQANQTLTTLRKVQEILKKIPKGQQKDLPSFPREISRQRNFTKCIGRFCSAFGDFFANFTASLPLAEMTGLPFDTCSCDPISGAFV